MKTYFINDVEVSRTTYEQYQEKELKRLKANCKDFDCKLYTVHSKVILNGIKFETREERN